MNTNATLTKLRQTIILDLISRMPGLTCQGKLGAFLDAYFVAEALARKLQSFYQTDTGKPTSDDLQITQLNAALRHFSVDYSPDDVREIFLGGKGNSGVKSARQLRNGYVHSLNDDDRAEIEENSRKITTLINLFVQAIEPPE
jgi:hypothetical protein